MHHRLQFDMRENPASDRRHGSRQAVRSLAARSGGDEESRTSLSLTTPEIHAHADSDGQQNGASPCVATGEKESNHLLTIQQVAELLHVPVSWVYGRTRKRSTQRLPDIRLGKYWRFREEEIHRWIESQRGGDCVP
jgi:excisionase family DNA binding protein